MPTENVAFMKKEVVSTAETVVSNASNTGALNKFVEIAKIGRPHGLTGAMHVFPYSREGAALRRAKAVVIRDREHGVASVRAHGDAFVMQIEGVESPEQAQRFTNAELSVSRDSFPVLPKGEFYWVDLIGLACTNGARRFGRIVEVFEAGAHPILRVRADNAANEVADELIPFVDAIVRSVDLDAQRVDVDWEGLE
jgi:16S rRNA processing protein RimM